jgi:hypothetical protein
MISRTFKFIYAVMVEIGQARHRQLKRHGYNHWY